jgi:hypothetical protein
MWRTALALRGNPLTIQTRIMMMKAERAMTFALNTSSFKLGTIAYQYS